MFTIETVFHNCNRGLFQNANRLVTKLMDEAYKFSFFDIKLQTCC